MITTAFAGYSQNNPDTVHLNREDALRKARQADSLQVAKDEIKELKNLNSIQEKRLIEKDTTAAGLRREINLKDELISSKNREIATVNEKFTVADTRGNDLNRKLKRANTRTIFGTIIGAAIPVVITILKNRR